MKNLSESQLRLVQRSLFVLAVLPFLYHSSRGVFASLENPVEYLTRASGDWALRLLLLTLLMTPLKRLTGWTFWIRLRRTLGLFTFFYASVHFLIYVLLDVALNADITARELFNHIVEDITKRPYITVGFTAFILLIPLAWTSRRSWQRRLGTAWKKLHRLVYLIAVLAVLHFYWLVKLDKSEPIVYAILFAIVLMSRWITPAFANRFYAREKKSA